MWKDRRLHETISGYSLPVWVRSYLLIQGIVVTALALVLLLAPEFMVAVWPWKITRLLAQIYSAPFLANGLSSLTISRLRTRDEIRVVTPTFVFAFGVLLASLIHKTLFSLSNISTWIWFGGFFLATLMLGFLTVPAIRERTSTI